jgi:hypothetical protein
MLRKLARKWWFWLGSSGLFLVALVVGGVYAEWAITRARGEALRDAAVHKLDAEDPCWRAADLCAARNASIPPPEQNAAERALKAVALLPQSYMDWTMAEKWRAELKPGVLPHDDDICEAFLVHEECGDALAVARSVRHLPRGGFKLVYKEPDPIGTLLDNTQKMREAGSLLDLDAIVLAYAGRADEAVGSCHAILNCGRGVGDEPTLISQLVRMALVTVAKNATERTLGWGESSTGLAELQAAFTEEMAVPRLTYGFRGERAMLFRLMENLDDGLIPLEDVAGGAGMQGGGSLKGRLGLAVYRKHIPRQQAVLLDILGQLLAADKLTGPARKAAFDQVQVPPLGFENILIGLLLPAWEKLFQAEDRTRALCATTAAALACERYRRTFGLWPESLDSIPKDILPEVPADPYTGRPLLYAATGDGVVVYATGPDGVDDGGTNLDPRGAPGTDIGFRLLDPDQRRQLPPPDPEPEPEPDGPPPERRP